MRFRIYQGIFVYFESFEKQILCSYQTMEKENNIDNQKRGQIMISLEELKKGKDLKYT